MTRSARNQAIAPFDIQRSPVAVTDERIGTGVQLSTRMLPAAADRPALLLEPLARNLQALAQQIDGLSKAEQVDAGQFVQLDMAARYALAASHAINAVDGTTHTLSEQRHAVSPREPNLGQIQRELAWRLTNRIFAAGLRLTALQALLGDGVLSDKVGAIVEELDDVIRDLRAGVLE